MLHLGMKIKTHLIRFYFAFFSTCTIFATTDSVKCHGISYFVGKIAFAIILVLS